VQLLIERIQNAAEKSMATFDELPTILVLLLNPFGISEDLPSVV